MSVLDHPVDSVGSESLMRDPAEKTGVRRRQLSANTGGSLKRREEGEFWVGSQESQGHGHQPGADGGCGKRGDTEEGRLAGNGACSRVKQAPSILRSSPVSLPLHHALGS